MENLEEELKEPFEYNFKDVFIPLYQMRHLPTIRKIKDSFIRGYETAVLTLLTASQLTVYYSLYEILTE